MVGAPKADAKAPSDGFSFNAPKTDDKPAAGGFSFGGVKAENKPAGGGFSFGGAKTDDKPAPGGFSLGAAKTEEKPAAGGFSFGAAKTEEKKDDKPTASGFSFGAPKPEEKKDDKPATGGFSFGAPKVEEKKDDKPATGGFSFGAPKVEEKKDDKPAPAGFSFGAKKDETNTQEKKDETKEAADKKTVSFTNSVIDRDEKKESAKTVEPKPVSLNNKTLEDVITKWTNQLSNASSSFQDYSTKVNEWDRVLVDGGEKISQLYTDTVTAEQTQNKIDQALLYIERQQDELENFLDNYEAKANNLLSGVLSSNSHASDSSVVTNDQKREQAYRTAELLDDNLSSLGTNLSSLITEINDVSDLFNKTNGLSSGDAAKKDDDSSLDQIVKLLNTHLDSLKWVEKNADDLKAKVDKFRDLDS